MSAAGKNSPRGSYFWALAPFLVLFLIVMPFANPPTATGVVALWVVETLVALMLLGLFNPFKFWWAWRSVGAIVFLGFASYLIAMIYEGKLLANRRAQPAAINAIGGLLAFGIPGLWFAMSGRLTRRWQPILDDDRNDEGTRSSDASPH